METISNITHGLRDPELAAAVGHCRVFPCMIGVTDLSFRAALRIGHLKRRPHESTTRPCHHSPADYIPRAHVPPHRQGTRPCERPHVCHVGEPETVRPIGREVPLEHIRREPLGFSRARRTAEFALQTHSAPQSRYALTPHAHPARQAQLRVVPGRSVGESTRSKLLWEREMRSSSRCTLATTPSACCPLEAGCSSGAGILSGSASQTST